MSWEQTARALKLHNDLVYNEESLKRHTKAVDVSIFGHRNRRPRCRMCKAIIPRHPNSIEIWKSRGELCKGCWLRKVKNHEFAE
jgi:hypothetical protein